MVASANSVKSRLEQNPNAAELLGRFSEAELLARGRKLLAGKKAAFELKCLMCIPSKATDEVMALGMKLLKPGDLDCVVEERALNGLCGENRLLIEYS
jgi:hypothetical protein